VAGAVECRQRRTVVRLGGVAGDCDAVVAVVLRDRCVVSVDVRVLAAVSLGGAGHFNPLVPFLEAARRRGDEVLVVGPVVLSDLVAATGFPFEAGGEPDEVEVAPIRERLPSAPPAEASILGNRDLFGRLAAQALLPTVTEVCERWKPDLLLRDPCEHASATAARRLHVRVAQVAISLAEAEWGSIAVAAPALEELDRGLTAVERATPYLTRLPVELDRSPFPHTLRFHDEPSSPPPLPDWWSGDRSSLVYVTFGTVLGHMTIAAGVYRTALRAVEGLGLRVLLTVGRRFDPAVLNPLPAGVHAECWVDQEQVLPAADLVVCHGGSGTVYGALAAGVPVVVAPVFADQFENGRRVAAAGAGLVVEADGDSRARVVDERDALRIRDAIGAVLATPGYRERAQAISASMAAAPSADEVLGALVSP
jgi:UDP:flavonoid glycosyltransferase YjiC (YdhE family)